MLDLFVFIQLIFPLLIFSLSLFVLFAILSYYHLSPSIKTQLGEDFVAVRINKKYVLRSNQSYDK